MSLEEMTKNAKAMQNVRYSNAVGVPQLIDLVQHEKSEQLEFCLKKLKLDPNIKYNHLILFNLVG
jgi:2-hydroxy-3-keto-5-methylthiopentenyl-1-phosphate phosphatase